MGNVTIQKGDILIFSAGQNDVFGKCISTLTRSDVCHTAMVYGDGKLVEVDGNGITVNSFVQDDEGEVVYVRRLKGMDPTPLIESANNYLKQDIKFDFASWAILSWLLIIWPTNSIPIAVDNLEKLILYAGTILDSLINRIGDIFFQKEPHKVMICSQLIYKIYEDCGEDYRIQVKGGLIKSLFEENIEKSTAPHDDKELVLKSRQPYNWYKSWEDPEVANAANVFLSAFMNKIQEEEKRNMPFYYEVTSEVGSEKLLNLITDLENIANYLHVEKPVSSLYVTPANMKDAENLEDVGTVRISRIKYGI